MPTFDSIISVSSKGSSKSSINGVVSKIEYYYNGLSLLEMEEYVKYIKEQGISVNQISDTEVSILTGDKKAASVVYEDKKISVIIVPEESRVTQVFTELPLDGTIELDFVKIELNGNYEISDVLLPNDTSGVYLEYDANEGSSFVIVRGTVTNTSAGDLESRYIDAVITLSDKYEYDCDVLFAANPASVTNYAIAPFESSPLYIYASVPNNGLDAAGDKIDLTIRFNDDFERIGNDAQYTYHISIR